MYRYNISDEVSSNAINFFESTLKKPEKPARNTEVEEVFEVQKKELEKELDKANNRLDLKRSEEITRLIEMVQGKIIELKQQAEEKEDDNREEEEFFNIIKEKSGKVER